MSVASRHSARAPLRLALLVSCMAFAPHAVRAQSTQTGVDVSVSGEAVSNPYLNEDDSTWVGAAALEIRPWLRRSNERDTIQLRGLARVRAFSARFDPETALGADLQATTRLSARTTAFGNANFLTSNRRTPFDVLTPRPGLSDPIVPPPELVPIAEPIFVLPGEDITLIGDPGRITTSSIGAGISHQIDPNSMLGYTVDYARLDGDDESQGIDYQSASVGASYRRQLTPRTQVGLQGRASKTRYEKSRPGATTFSLSGTLAQQLGRYWSLSGSAGVSSTKAEGNALFPGYSAVSPIASLSICHQPVRRNFCFGYTRSQQPSFLGDVRTSDSVTASYSEQFSQSRRVDLNAAYGRSKGDEEANARFPDVEVLTLRGVFTQTINDRTEGYVSGSVSKRYGGFLSGEPSIAFGAGLRLRLGTRR